jgi:hypothetical protein
MGQVIDSLHSPKEYVTKAVGMIIGEDPDQLMCTAGVTINWNGKVLAARGIISSQRYQARLRASLDEDPTDDDQTLQVNAMRLQRATADQDIGFGEKVWIEDLISVLVRNDPSTLGTDLATLRTEAPSSIARMKDREVASRLLPSGTVLWYDLKEQVDAFDDERLGIVQRAVNLEVPYDSTCTKYRFFQDQNRQTLWQQQESGMMSAYASLATGVSKLSETKVRRFTGELLVAQLEVDLTPPAQDE